MAVTVEPFFLAVGGRSRFCLYHPPAPSSAAQRGAIVYIHPFAEEMNFSRRMAALQSRALAAQGYAVLQIDLLGCGDSAGDFSEARWADWVADSVAAARWVQARRATIGAGPLTFWGLRAGCLLAAEAASAMNEPVDFLFWQPVLSGEAYWRQFRRLAIAAKALENTDDTRVPESGRETENPPVIEIAGYCIARELIAGLSASRLVLPTNTRRVNCVEVSTWQSADESTTAASAVSHAMSPLLASAITAWREQGVRVYPAVVPGTAFWQIAEADDCPALRAATVQLVTEEDGNGAA